MSTDSTDPTRTPGIAGDADTGAPHSQAPEGPDASGTHSAPQVSQPSPRGEDGSDPRRRLVAVRSEVGKAVVGQQEVGEDGAGPEGELGAAGVVDE